MCACCACARVPVPTRVWDAERSRACLRGGDKRQRRFLRGRGTSAQSPAEPEGPPKGSEGATAAVWAPNLPRQRPTGRVGAHSETKTPAVCKPLVGHSAPGGRTAVPPRLRLGQEPQAQSTLVTFRLPHPGRRPVSWLGPRVSVLPHPQAALSASGGERGSGGFSFLLPEAEKGWDSRQPRGSLMRYGAACLPHAPKSRSGWGTAGPSGSKQTPVENGEGEGFSGVHTVQA